MNLMKLTIDGKTVEASPGTLVILLLRRTYSSGRLPPLSGRGREGPEADDRVHAAGC
jgi:hypothetical protein